MWLYTTRNHLRFVAKFAPMLAPGWAGVAAEIIAKLQTAPAGPPTGDPDARLPGATLRRWIQVRDGTCTFPGCRAPAHRADADHTTEHAKGGKTVDSELAPACRHDHRLRHDGGWQVTHDAPGKVSWTSPLGHTYQRHRPPGLLDLPEPRPGAIDERDPEPPPCDPPPGADPESCLQQPPEPEPPPEPIPTSRPAQDGDEIPPF